MSIKFNPFTGALDIGTVGSGGGSLTEAEQAQRLIVKRIASVDIVIGDALYATSNTHVGLAEADTTINKAMVFGFAVSNALAGSEVEILIFGILDDSVFSIFNINDPLFLDVSGGITDIKRTSGYHVVVGKSFGGSQIFVNIKDPLVIA